MEPLTRKDTTRKIRLDGIRMEQEAADFIKPNAALSSLERIQIYNQQYWFRLYASFEDDFPGLRTVLGRRQFEQVMRAYLDAHPSTSYTLRDLGSQLASFLADHHNLTAPNSLLAQDVVRLEWAHIEAYDAATLLPPTPDFFASITDQTVLHLQPCLRLLSLSYPVDELLIAVRHDAGSNDASSNNATVARRTPRVRRLAQPAPAPLCLAVHRQEFTVFYKRLQLEEYRMLIAIQSGEPLREVFTAAFRDSPMDEIAQAALLHDAFQHWAILGWLCAPEDAHNQTAVTGDRT